MRLAVVLSDLAAPPKSGLQEQSLLLLEGLIAAGFEVDLFAFAKAQGEIRQAALPVPPAAALIPMRIGWTLTGLGNRLVGSRGLESRLAGYDAVYLEGAAAAGLLRSSWADRAIVNWIDPGSRRRLRFAGGATDILTKCRELLAAGLAFLLEASLNDKHATWVVVSESDADYLRRVHGHSQTMAIPVMLPELPSPLAHDVADAIVVTVYADLREKHMWEAFERLAARVLRPACEALPGLRVQVLGRLLPSDDQLARLPKLPVTFAGWSEDHLGDLQRSDIVVLPDQVGTGLKNRAVQCLGLGCAIVGTSVAFEAIPVTSGNEALVVNTDGEMLDALLLLSNNASLRAQVRRSASTFARTRYGQRQVMDKWVTLIQSRGTAR
jgi:glycosyltransferase involved in cell wall biosynthesis